MSDDKGSKIFQFPAKKKQSSQTIDVSNPVFTVYGVQAWAGDILLGTSLYESQSKQMFVISALREKHDNDLKIEKENPPADIRDQIPDMKYKAINYPVY